jgi:exonuclease SbcC
LPDEVAAGLEQAVSTSREAEAAAATAARVAGERYSQCGRDVALLQGQAAGHEQRRDAARAALGGWLGARGVEESAVRAARLGAGEQRELRERVGASDRAVRAARERTEQASELLGAHLGARPAGWEPGAASAVTLEAAQATREDAHTASRAAAADQARLQEMRRAEEAALADVAELRGDLEARQAELAVWSQINELIGVNGGQRFMEAAQARNLQFLLDAANRQLELLAPRYRFRGLENNGLPTLEFAVLDLELADETRPVSTLSGGETFLCSLALALGLASMRRHRLPIETLLLDEGFGTLDPRSLDQAMQALEALQAGGARVGIISHVGALTERVAARVRVEQSEGGRSRLVVE